jgi:hypothetical protein
MKRGNHMINSLRRKKKEIIVFFIIYLLIDIFVVGAFFVSGLGINKDLSGFDKISKVMEGFIPNLTNPFNTFWEIVTSGSEFGSFLKISLWILLMFIGMYIYYLIKNGKKYEYEGTENGSSDWSKRGRRIF